MAFKIYKEGKCVHIEVERHKRAQLKLGVGHITQTIELVDNLHQI